MPIADHGRVFNLAATSLASRRSATRTGLGTILGQAAVLTDLAGIACTSAVLAARVDKALHQPLRVPPLFVREDRRAAA